MISRWNNKALVVQCKDHSLSTKPIWIRELEGTVNDQEIGLLVTSLPWSRQAIIRLHASSKLLIGMVLEVDRDEITDCFVNIRLQKELSSKWNIGRSLNGKIVIEKIP